MIIIKILLNNSIYFLIIIYSLKVALVLGANGYVGYPVSKLFALNGYLVYGLIRNKANYDRLAHDEVPSFIFIH